MIELRHLVKTYGDVAVVRDVSLSAPEAAVTVLLGPPGSGKSTILRMINRLIPADSGSVWIDDEDTAAIHPEALRRRIGYVIQGVGLFPHWNVARNIATVPALLGWPRKRIAARVEQLLDMVNLPPDRFAEKRPSELSGGQAQRVGIARALAADPSLLLMDEPFSALDPVTRRDLQQAFRRIQRDTGKTVVFVTHDLEEALLLGDQVALLRDGKLIQHGPPLQLLEHPADDFVADYFGGAAAGLRRLTLLSAASRAVPGEAGGARLPAQASLHDALEAMLSRGTESVALEGGGVVTLKALLA